MATLPIDWLTQGIVDFEYKKYLILSYLKNIKEAYDRYDLYPSWSELKYHYTYTKAFIDQKHRLAGQFPTQIQSVDWKRFSIESSSLVQEGELERVLDDIVAFALPRFEKGIAVGQDMFEEVASTLSIEPVGVIPLVKDAGYILVYPQPAREVKVYRYETSFFLNTLDTHRSVQFHLLDVYTPGIGHTPESKKLELVRKQPQLPNPATYFIQTTKVYPEQQTLLPVVQQLLMSYIESNQ